MFLEMFGKTKTIVSRRIQFSTNAILDKRNKDKWPQLLLRKRRKSFQIKFRATEDMASERMFICTHGDSQLPELSQPQSGQVLFICKSPSLLYTHKMHMALWF